MDLAPKKTQWNHLLDLYLKEVNNVIRLINTQYNIQVLKKGEKLMIEWSVVVRGLTAHIRDYFNHIVT